MSEPMTNRCGLDITKAQFLESRVYRETYQTWPGVVSQLAEALYRGENCAFALHDALLEAGCPSLAEHFAGESVHPGSRAGPGQCRIVKLLMGSLTARQQLLGTPEASVWLGISAARFRRLAQKMNVAPDSYYSNGPFDAFLWSPETVLELEGILPVQ